VKPMYLSEFGRVLSWLTVGDVRVTGLQEILTPVLNRSVGIATPVSLALSVRYPALVRLHPHTWPETVRFQQEAARPRESRAARQAQARRARERG
jgi:hypothetical protein